MKNASLAVFPYRQSTSGQFFPVVPLTVYAQNGKSDVSALVDSGATVSIFKIDVAEKLGFTIEKGEKIVLGGVGGKIKGYKHQIKVEIAKKIFILSVIFSYEYLVSFNLLGREAFFENFLVIFDERKRMLRLE